jgi:fatty-acyl-CoA synthase
MAVSREDTQAKLAKLSAGTLQHVPSQTYTLADRFEERALHQASRCFIVFEGQRISYGEFNARANRIAHVAHAAGLRRGDTAALLMTNRPEFIVTWAGLAKLGVTTALINPNIRGPALGHALDAGACRHVFVGAELLGSLDASVDAAFAGRTVFVDAEGAEAVPAGTVNLAARLAGASTQNPDLVLRDGLVAGDDLFYVYTSGTTGLPKAARLSHMRYLGVGDGMSAVSGYGPDEVILCVLPLYHGAGGMVVVSCALSQAATVVLERRFSASRFWDTVRDDRVTACQYIGEICRYLLNQPPDRRDREHGLRLMMGAGLGADIWSAFQERFGVERILEGWSSTEANTSLINVDNRPGSCGRIPFEQMHNGRLVRYDVEADSHPRGSDGRPIECEAGEVGEFIGMIPDLPDSGAGRFEGYTSAEATEAKILRDVFAAGDAWYRSGDLLRRDEEGYFYFVDRIGDTYRWKSENVSTQEVAEALSGFPGLRVANVYGVRVPGCEGRAGMAALVFDPGEPFDGRAFHDHAVARLPGYAVPLFVRIAREADMTTTFKLRKLDLQRDGYDPARVDGPLFLLDGAASAYLPLDGAALARVGIAPFEPEDGSESAA